MSPPVAMQIMSAMKIVMGEDGTDEGKLHCIIVKEFKPFKCQQEVNKCLCHKMQENFSQN